jgi:hypothetical protein
MATLAQQTGYLAEATARWLEQYKDKPKLNALLASFMSEIQACENALYNVYVQRELQSPSPPLTDLLYKFGQIVGQGSMGQIDGVYRVLILARIGVNTSDGRRKDLINVVRTLYSFSGQSFHVNVFEPNQPPAGPSVVIYPDVTDPLVGSLTPAQLLSAFVRPTADAGVAVSLITSHRPRYQTIIPTSVHSAGFAAGPPPSDFVTGTGQIIGSVHHAGFTAGPVPSSAGGGWLATVATA